MSRKFVVRSDSYGECVYLRMFGRGRYGSKFGLVRSPAEATTFSSRFEAGTKAGRAGNVIMREFNAVELDAIPAATTRPDIDVRITAWLWTIVEEEAAFDHHQAHKAEGDCPQHRGASSSMAIITP